MLNFNKIRILFILLIFSVSIAGLAQKRASLGLSFGAGYSGYFFVTDNNIFQDYIDYSFVPVYNTGLIFNYLDGIVGLQTGVSYAQKGWIETFNNGATNQVNVGYVEVPFLTQFRFGRKKKSGWVLNFGIYGGFVMDTNEKESELKFDSSLDTAFIKYNELEYNTFEYGIKAGGGYELGLGKNSLQLELMFTQGMLNFFEADRVGVYRSLSQTLTFNLIYKFTLYRKSE